MIDIDRLRRGEVEFNTEEALYKFWRKYPFKIGRAIQNQLQKLLADAKR